MAGTSGLISDLKDEASSPLAPAVNREVKSGTPDATSVRTIHADKTSTTSPPDTSLNPSEPRAASHSWRKLLLLAGMAFGLVATGYFLFPSVETMLNTVSTDDAYVNGHVTFVAPRVAGQVSRVLVEDNNRVKKGDLLVQLDKEPYQVQVQSKQALVATAETDLAAAKAQVRSLLALVRSQRWQLQSALEQAATQAVNLRALVASYESKKAQLQLMRSNLVRGEELATQGGIGKEDLDQRRQTVKINESDVEQALQMVYASRVALGLSEQPGAGQYLTEVPPNFEQTFSAVRSTLASMTQTMSQIGLPLTSMEAGPRQVLDEFSRRVFSGDIDNILAQLIPNAPGVKQAEAKLLQARCDLRQAELNLQYCDIVSEVDGVVTNRNLNPGNNVQAGQSLMSIRSLTEIWIDANFKETQLADLRIGQRVRCEVDMYGSKREYEGRITGFTMGTGQSIALLPPQNATGNYVKIVQRLPVRIELTNYNPDKDPLFIGLSVTPFVYFKEPPAGPQAGNVLQQLLLLPNGSIQPKSKPLSEVGNR